MVSPEIHGLPIEESPDRIIIRLDPGGPIELTGLSDSFAALARFYRRHYRLDPDQDEAPKLYVTKLETGSIVAEIVPLAMIFGTIVPYMDTAIIVSDFTRRVWQAIKAFSDSEPQSPLLSPFPTAEDASDIREFIKPLAGKRGAQLGITHARFHSRTSEREIIAEYRFDEAEINRAALAIDNDDFALLPTADNDKTEGTRLLKEVMLFFQQASRGPGKEEGRTADKGIVPEITDKPLPVYFREGIQDLKDRMVRGLENPLKSAYVVDVIAQFVEGNPKGYIVTDVHHVIPDEE
jgi:hypothetical protein